MKEHLLTLRLFLILALHWAAQNASAQVISVRDSLMDIEADTMPEPFRMLPELFVTPDGSNPVDYILDNVARKAQENRKTLNYTSTTTFHVYASNMDLLPQFLSKTQNWAVKTGMGLMGMRAMYNYVTSHEETALGISVTQKARGNDTDYSEEHILFSPSDMPEKAGEQIMKMARFPMFDAVYGDKSLLDRKKRHKVYEIEYIGTAEEKDGSLYYILKIWRNKGKAYQRITTLHIADGSWGVLRQENRSSLMSSYIQCENISGVLLPIKCVQNPNPMSMEELAAKAKRSITNRKLDKGKVSKRSKKLLERIEKVASGEQRDAPMIRYSFAVVYH